jgi:integrase|tara:strand:+ start:16 stop:510 length:495 start_codon:yes stop_codon:yes gene_type:complete
MARKLFEVITEEELLKILEKTKKPRQKLAYALGFYEAMRISEIVNLLPEHIDKGSKQIKIKKGKGNKDRNIPIHPRVLRGLKNLPVGVGVRALQISFKKKAKEVLGRDLHFHTLRHSGVTHYVNDSKWSSLQVQRLVGHADIRTTQLYTHIKNDDLVANMWDKA